MDYRGFIQELYRSKGYIPQIMRNRMENVESDNMVTTFMYRLSGVYPTGPVGCAPIIMGSSSTPLYTTPPRFPH